jgi:hypothetical protein
LPFDDVLEHGNMADLKACSLCGLDDSWRHSLFECNVAQAAWDLEGDMIDYLVANGLTNARVWLLR